jgi:hypothetical protein
MDMHEASYKATTGLRAAFSDEEEEQMEGTEGPRIRRIRTAGTAGPNSSAQHQRMMPPSSWASSVPRLEQILVNAGFTSLPVSR